MEKVVLLTFLSAVILMAILGNLLVIVQGHTAQVSHVRQPHEKTWVEFGALPGELESEFIISARIYSYEGKKYMAMMFGK